MRHLLLLFSAAVIMAVTATSCGDPAANNNDADQHEAHEHTAQYACPMQCEGDKTYAEAGKCPSCGMDLKAIADEHDHEGHEHGEHDDD